MMKNGWLITILGSFALALGTSEWAMAEEPAVPEAEAAEPEAVEESAEREARTDLALVLPPAPPRSLQSLVDERREELQKRRRARFDLYSGRHLYLPPGMLGHDPMMDRYREVIREAQRQQRDYARLNRDAWMSLLAPWSKPHRDWAEARHYAIQMEQLNWEELRDDRMLGPPFAHSGVFPLY